VLFVERERYRDRDSERASERETARREKMTKEERIQT